MEEKIKLIDKIVKKHPSYGVEKGWSEYTGGMKDSGSWFFREMLDVPTDELQDFLKSIEEYENKPEIELTEQEKIDSKIIVNLSGGGWTTKLNQDKLEEYFNEKMNKLLFGDYK